MKYCTYCGKELVEEAAVCPGCGCPTEKKSQFTRREPEPDEPSAGLDILGFFVPPAGFVLCLVKLRNYPRKARQIGLFAVIGLIIYIIILILWSGIL